MKLDPEALKPAADEFLRYHANSCYPQAMDSEAELAAQKIITAYLASLPQSQDIRALVEELRRLSGLYASDYGYNVATTLDRAAAALSCLAGEGWRPISDAPKDGTHVLIAQRRGDSDKWSVLEGHFVKRSRRSRNGTWYGTGDYGEEEFSQQYEPTHWMPLPAAPSVEEKLP